MKTDEIIEAQGNRANFELTIREAVLGIVVVILASILLGIYCGWQLCEVMR